MFPSFRAAHVVEGRWTQCADLEDLYSINDPSLLLRNFLDPSRLASTDGLQEEEEDEYKCWPRRRRRTRCESNVHDETVARLEIKAGDCLVMRFSLEFSRRPLLCRQLYSSCPSSGRWSLASEPCPVEKGVHRQGRVVTFLKRSRSARRVYFPSRTWPTLEQGIRFYRQAVSRGSMRPSLVPHYARR